MWRQRKIAIENIDLINIFKKTLILTWLKEDQLKKLLRDYTHSEIRFFYIEGYLKYNISDVFFLVIDLKKKNWKENILYYNYLK